MEEPRWIREDAVRLIHVRQIAEHGGGDGIRDEGLLASALARPRNLLAYASAREVDLAALAAAYAYGIAKKHPFVDGKKRTAFVVCHVFLLLNGHELSASAEDRYLTFLGLAEGRIGEGELATWIRERLIEKPMES